MKNAHALFSLITAATLLASPTASAVDGKSYPGSNCKSAGSGQNLYFGSFSSGAIAGNRTNSVRSVVCPFTRDIVMQPYQHARVYVRDRHSTRDISCQVHAFDTYGQVVDASPIVTSTGEGFQALSFGAALAAGNWGSYTLSCTLPPMENNLPSYISAYRLSE